MDTTIDDAEPDNDDQGLPVPLASLSVNGTPPQVGDTIEAKVGGKVTKIDGDTAYFEPETVNGQSLPETQDEPDERDAIEQQSANAGDIGSGGY